MSWKNLINVCEIWKTRKLHVVVHLCWNTLKVTQFQCKNNTVSLLSNNFFQVTCVCKQLPSNELQMSLTESTHWLIRGKTLKCAAVMCFMAVKNRHRWHLQRAKPGLKAYRFPASSTSICPWGRWAPSISPSPNIPVLCHRVSLPECVREYYRDYNTPFFSY